MRAISAYRPATAEHAAIHPIITRISRGSDPAHLRVRVNTQPTGTPPGNLDMNRASIQAALGAWSLRVQITGPNTAILDLRWYEPLARLVRPADLPKAPENNHALIPVVVGLDDNLEAVVNDAIYPQLLVGSQGAGKSSQVWAYLDGLRRLGIPVRVRVFDPKGGQEFGELEGCVHEYAKLMSGWPGLIANMRKALETRQAMLAKRGVRRMTEFTRAEPLDVLIVDELLTLKNFHNSGKKGAAEARDDFEHVLSQGRAAGFSAIVCTQNGTKEVVGQLAELFPVRTCMRVASDTMAAVVLNAAAARYPAHLIKRPGEGYMLNGGHVVHYRAAYIAGPDQWRVVNWLRSQHADGARAARGPRRRPTVPKEEAA